MTMGTASTMTSVAEALGLTPARRGLDSGGRSPTTRAWRALSGRRIVEMVWEDLKPRDILDRRERSTTRSPP